MGLASQGIFLWIFALSIMLFYGNMSVDQVSGNINSTSFDYLQSNLTSSIGTIGIGSYNISLIPPRVMDVLLSPQNFFTSALFGWIITFIVALGIAGISTAVFRITVTDAVAYSPFFIMYLVMGIFPSLIIMQFLRSELATYLCGSSGNCLFASFLAFIIGGSLAFNWMTDCLKFWRTGFTE